MELNLPSLNEQKEIVKKLDAFGVINAVAKIASDDSEIPVSWLEFSDERFDLPSPEEIRETFKPFTGSQVARMLGIQDARTIRKWIGGESKIPYAAWRLWLIKTGRVYEPLVVFDG